MSKRLDDFIKANREQFDDLEPGADIWARIEKARSKNLLFRVCAALSGGRNYCDGRKLPYIFKERGKRQYRRRPGGHKP